MSVTDHRKSEGACIWCHAEWPCAVAEIAHELAEKIRQSAPCYGGAHHYDDGECHRTFDAADLIDPEVE